MTTNRRIGCNTMIAMSAALTLVVFGVFAIAASGTIVAGTARVLLDPAIEGYVFNPWVTLGAVISLFVIGAALLRVAWFAAGDADRQLRRLKRKPKAIEGEIPDAEADYAVGDDGELVPIEDEKPKREQGR